jgi:hypothetical protein
VNSIVLRRDTEGTVKSVKDAKVAVFAQVRMRMQKYLHSRQIVEISRLQ